MLRKIVLFVVSAIALFIIGKTYRRFTFVKRVRARYSDIPHFPRHWFFGNLIDVGKRLSPSINAHPDYGFKEMWEELGEPPAFFVDLTPIDRAMMIVCHPAIAEALVQPSSEYKYSIPKSNTLQALTKLVGDQSLILIEGEEWRTQRRRFNKGFAPAHLNTLLPLIVSKTRIFLDRLEALARDGKPFELKDLAADLTLDVITQVAIDKDFHAQTVLPGTGAKSRYGILTAITKMSILTQNVSQGFQWLSYQYPKRVLMEYIYGRIYTRSVYREIITKLPSPDGSIAEKSSDSASSARAIVHLALSGLQPSAQVINSTISQVKTFLFAGEDTTSTVIQWMAYYLSRSYPSSPLYSERLRQIRERLCQEHDEAFGKGDPFAPLELLSRSDVNVDEVLGVKLPHTIAFIKETLRLHPPAASARIVPMAPYDPSYPDNPTPNPYFVDMPAWTHSKTGEFHESKRVRVDGMRFYNNQFIMHRNPAIWGPDVAEFDPSRFLDRNRKGGIDEREEVLNNTEDVIHYDGDKGLDQLELPHPYHISKLPPGAHRPFERGPRNCIGSNLAYMEAKIVLAVIARGFEWQKVGLDGTKPDPGEVNYHGTGKEDLTIGESQKWTVWNIQQVTSVPVDGMKMRVKLQDSW